MNKKHSENHTILKYIISHPRAPITLNLYEAERYESAIVVQQLIGNLVYHSNQGRYEPRLAESWSRTSSNRWEFYLKKNCYCENGEKITSAKFEQSLLRSIKKLSKGGPLPVFEKLKGFSKFVKNQSSSLEGIKSEGQKLIFEFERPLKSGLVQVLSFAPFGYICEENVNKDGSWKYDEKFISSGPYRVKSVSIGHHYILEKNPQWQLEFLNNSPSEIHITHEIPDHVSSGEYLILDNLKKEAQVTHELNKYTLVPEYINSLLLGNLKKGPFSNLHNRLHMKYLINKNKDILPQQWERHTKSDTFYPNQKLQDIDLKYDTSQVNFSNKTLIIEGEEPKEPDFRYYAWKVLKAALQEGDINYKFSNTKTSWEHMTNQEYDIRIRGSSIGGGIEVWGLSIVFCSDLGIKFPDPSGQICQMIKDYDDDKLDDEGFSHKFFKVIEEDAAIIPISHFGMQLFLTSNIDTNSIKPTLNIIKFDQLGLE